MQIGGHKIRNQAGIHFITFSVVEWVDVFTRKGYVDILLESLCYCQESKGLQIHAWCVMSNHVHLAVSAKEANLSAVMRDFKKFTSKQILDAIDTNRFRESRRSWMIAIFRQAGAANTHNDRFQFWQQELHPILLESYWFARQKVDYIHRNPVVAGLVRRPEDYVWSSAMDYAGTGKGVLRVEKIGYPETESPDN